jgi:hypothetical protein
VGFLVAFFSTVILSIIEILSETCPPRRETGFVCLAPLFLFETDPGIQSRKHCFLLTRLRGRKRLYLRFESRVGKTFCRPLSRLYHAFSLFTKNVLKIQFWIDCDFSQSKRLPIFRRWKKKFNPVFLPLWRVSAVSKSWMLALLTCSFFFSRLLTRIVKCRWTWLSKHVYENGDLEAISHRIFFCFFFFPFSVYSNCQNCRVSWF